MREVARNDYDKALTVERWPLVEVLHAYMDLLKSDAEVYYRTSLLMWAARGTTSKPPKPPSILDD